MFRTYLVALCAAITPWAASAQTASPPTPQPATASAAQTPQNVPDGGVPTYIRPETPEQRKARVGTAEDPGLDPDPNKHFWRFGKACHIEKFDRRFAAYDQVDPGYVRPMAMVNFAKEIYQQNENYVWVWIVDPQPDEAKIEQAPPSAYNKATIDFLRKIRMDFSSLTPPTRSDMVVRFEDSSEGLPKQGSWRNSLAIADMNEDGCPDIIVPPERAGGNVPAIFLGDCKGHWKLWKDVKWPYTLDYGSVVAADFNKDGHMDLAFAVHLHGVFVWLGDGKGTFTPVEEGLPRNFPTRRIAVADVDGDGYPDIVGISEGPTAVDESQRIGKIRAFLNRKKGTAWQGIDISDPSKFVGGDWLAVGDFNGDRRPDFAGASVYFNSQDILYLSSGPKKWQAVPSDGWTIPSLSYYFANAAGKFASKKRDDVVVSYVHFWPTSLDPSLVPKPPLQNASNVDLISFPGGKLKRTPIMRWEGSGVWAMGTGDFDGDGNLDILFTRLLPRDVVLLLGDGKGGFTRVTAEGLKLEPETNYDLRVADLNGDGRPDVIIMYETSSTTSLSPRTGSIHVFLNRGPAPASSVASGK